jgi:hypothetical protein
MMMQKLMETIQQQGSERERDKTEHISTETTNERKTGSDHEFRSTMYMYVAVRCGAVCESVSQFIVVNRYIHKIVKTTTTTKTNQPARPSVHHHDYMNIDTYTYTYTHVHTHRHWPDCDSNKQIHVQQHSETTLYKTH